MNILITGGAGFIGMHTAMALHAAGHRVRVLDLLDPQIHGVGAQFSQALLSVAQCIRGDVCDQAVCSAALEGVDCVFHFAARTGVGQSMYDVGDYVATNVHGTATLIEAIVKKKSALRRFVLASSRAVYGEGWFECERHGSIHPLPRDVALMKAGVFDALCPFCREPMQAKPTPVDCECRPLSVYAITKLQQEEYARYAAHTFGLPLVVLRYFNVYGSMQSLRNPYTGVISIFNGLLRNSEPISLYEHGRPIRDFVHVYDVVRANLLAMAPTLRTGDIFNIGSGQATTIAEAARILAATMGLTPQLEDYGEYRVGDIFACYADLSHSRQVLGYEPQVDLRAGMSEFVSWAQGQTAGDYFGAAVRELKAHGLLGRITLPAVEAN